jgi:hypothetical protein
MLKKKPIHVVVFFLKKKRATAPASTADPKKVKKIDFVVGQFVFLAPPARCGSNKYHVHRSGVNIYRVITRNESAVFKDESTYLYISCLPLNLPRVRARTAGKSNTVN